MYGESSLYAHLFVGHYTSWIFREYRGLETAIFIASIGCTVQLAEVYAGVFELPNS